MSELIVNDLNIVDDSKLKQIGNPSSNGFIIEVPFIKKGFTAYAALKCSTSSTSDNLFYEYYVGKYFINNYLKILPCFIETYDIYAFKDEYAYNEVQGSLANKLTKFGINIEENLEHYIDKSCNISKYICLLIQHFDNFYSLDEKLKSDYDNVKLEIFTILYQAYYPLCFLGKTYTHYDFHTDNIALYKPFNDKQCVLMRYHRNNKVIEFKSEYIVKIIDYGRNYFNNGKLSTNEFIELLYKVKPDYVSGYGYSSICAAKTNALVSTDPSQPNMSHDLRAAIDLKYELLEDNIVETIKYIYKYGTPEDMTGNTVNVTNIFNLRDALEDIIPKFVEKLEKKYGDWKVVATMDIYDDGNDFVFSYNN